VLDHEALHGCAMVYERSGVRVISGAWKTSPSCSWGWLAIHLPRRGGHDVASGSFSSRWAPRLSVPASPGRICALSSERS